MLNIYKFRKILTDYKLQIYASFPMIINFINMMIITAIFSVGFETDTYFLVMLVLGALNLFAITPFDQFLVFISKVNERERENYFSVCFYFSVIFSLIYFLILLFSTKYVFFIFTSDVIVSTAHKYAVTSLIFTLPTYLIKNYLIFIGKISLPYIVQSIGNLIFTFILLSLYILEYKNISLILYSIFFYTSIIFFISLFLIYPFLKKTNLEWGTVRECVYYSSVLRTGGNIYTLSISAILSNYFSSLSDGMFSIYGYVDRIVNTAVVIIQGPMQAKFTVNLYKFLGESSSILFSKFSEFRNEYISSTLPLLSVFFGIPLFIFWILYFIYESSFLYNFCIMLTFFSIQKIITLFESVYVNTLNGFKNVKIFYFVNLIYAIILYIIFYFNLDMINFLILFVLLSLLSLYLFKKKCLQYFVFKDNLVL